MKRNIFFKDQTEMLQGSCTAEILISLRAKGFTQNVRAYFMSILAIQQPFNIFNFYFYTACEPLLLKYFHAGIVIF